MRRNDITLRVTRLSMPALSGMGSNVYAKMNGNPAFPEPPVSMPEMESMIKRFTGLITLATHGSKLALIQRNSFAGRFADMLTQQAHYVRSCAGGRAEILVTSGFPLRKLPQAIGIPGATAWIQARTGHAEGEIRVRWKTVKGAMSYAVFARAYGPSGEWILVGRTTRASFHLNGLASGTKHAFMVQALGTAGAGLMSAMAVGMAA